MPAVTKLDPDILFPSWELIRSALSDMTDGGFVTLTVDDDTWLIVLFVANLGYLAVTTKGERDYFNLIERSLGDEIVTAFDGGNMNEYPRFTFVSQPILLKAAEFFFLDGERDASFEWVPEADARY